MKKHLKRNNSVLVVIIIFLFQPTIMLSQKDTLFNNLTIVKRDSAFKKYKRNYLKKHIYEEFTPEEWDEKFMIGIIKSAWQPNVFHDENDIISFIIYHLNRLANNNRLDVDTFKLKYLFGTDFEFRSNDKFFWCIYSCKYPYEGCYPISVTFWFRKSTGLVYNIQEVLFDE